MSTYHVTWLAGSGDRSLPSRQEVEAAAVDIDADLGFTILRDEQGTPVLAVNHMFLISVERVTEKG